MHTDKAFADTLVRFGECAHTAAEIVSGIRNEHVRLQRLTSIIRAMARFFCSLSSLG
jgi:phenylalanine-4-hydroxylase